MADVHTPHERLKPSLFWRTLLFLVLAAGAFLIGYLTSPHG